MIETGLRVHSACWETGAWTLAMNSVALRWRVAANSSCCWAPPPAEWPALSAAACVAARFAIFLSQDWTWCYRDGAHIQWGLRTAHKPGPLEHTAAAAAAVHARPQHARRPSSSLDGRFWR
jgi:hypothetical protein